MLLSINNPFVSLSVSFCQKAQVILTIKCSGVKTLQLVQQTESTWFRICAWLLFWGINQNFNSLVLWVPLSCAEVFEKEYAFSMKCYSTPWKSWVGLQTSLTLSDECAIRFLCRFLSLCLWTCCLLLQVFLRHQAPSTVVFSSCFVTSVQ